MNRTPDQKLAAAQAAQAATEKALLLAEAAARRAQSAKADFKLAKKTWKLARKAAKRTAKEARRLQKKLAKFATTLKQAKPRQTAKPGRSKHARPTRTPGKPRLSPKQITPETVAPPTALTAAGN